MWAGQTAPFFCLKKSKTRKSKKARKGPFLQTRDRSAFEVFDLAFDAIPLFGIRQ